MRAIETASKEKRFAVFYAQLLGNPCGDNMVGELRFGIVLRAKIPGAVPAFWLILDFFIKPLEPLSRAWTHDMELLFEVHATMKHLSRA